MSPQTVAEPLKWLGETIGFWTQNLILLISAGAAIGVIYSTKNQEKRRATIDVVVEQIRDKELVDARFLLLSKHDAGETNLARYLDRAESIEYKAIIRVLNAYEFVASGIRSSGFDEKTYKRLRYTTLLKDWRALCPFVMEFRHQKKSDTLFQDFQWLYGRWKHKPLKADERPT